ncbi:MAG: DUF3592 domain-containing protein [Pseudomonadales bacterium]|nr:DUF3592 domain-containing protein [Pseudomonadales bacterium]
MSERSSISALGVFWGLGVLAMLAGAWWWQQQREVENWPTVPAEVLASEVVSVPERSSLTGRVRLATEDGRVHEILLGWSSDSPALLEAALAVAPTGARVLAPLDPEGDGTPRLPPSWQDYVGPAVIGLLGVLFLLVPASVVMIGRRGDVGRVVGRTVVLVGLLFVVVGAVDAGRQYVRSNHWPAVEAEVLESRLRPRTVYVRRSSGPGRYDPSYGIDLRVAYVVDGERLDSRFRAETVATTDRAGLEARVAGPLAPGRTVLVRHDPSRPRVLMLDPDRRIPLFGFAAMFLGMGVVVLGLGIAVGRRSERDRRSDAHSPPGS